MERVCRSSASRGGASRKKRPAGSRNASSALPNSKELSRANHPSPMSGGAKLASNSLRESSGSGARRNQACGLRSGNRGLRPFDPQALRFEKGDLSSLLARAGSSYRWKFAPGETRVRPTRVHTRDRSASPLRRSVPTCCPRPRRWRCRLRSRAAETWGEPARLHCGCARQSPGCTRSQG